MTRIPIKYKVRITYEELLEMKDAIEQYSAHYMKEVISEKDELEVYRLSDLHTLLYSWINPKLNSFEKSGRKVGTYDIPLTHVMTLRHVLLEIPISRRLQTILAQIDSIKVQALPIYLSSHEILL